MLEKLPDNVLDLLYKNKIDYSKYSKLITELEDLTIFIRKYGLESLLEYLNKHNNLEAFIYYAMMLPIHKVNPIIIEEILLNVIISTYKNHYDLIPSLLISQTAISISVDENPRILVLKLKSILGENYEEMHDMFY